MPSAWSGCIILCLFICSFKFTTANENIGKFRENGVLRSKRHVIHICGQPIKHVFKPFVVNGTYATFGEFPWHVAIYQTTEIEPEQKYICGGSIISENCILTAAHCFADDKGNLFNSKEFFIAAGKYYRSYNSESDIFAQKRKVAKVNIHPHYKGILSNYGWDIAVVDVDQPFEISNIVHPVCVDWTNSFENEQLVDDNFGQVAGWGATETNLYATSLELRKLSVPFVNHSKCLEHLPSDFFRYVTHDKICAGYINGSSTCSGDSGGGLVFERIENQGTSYYIRGILSLGVWLESNYSCDYNKYTTYTRVSTYISFIRKNKTSNSELSLVRDLLGIYYKISNDYERLRNAFGSEQVP